MKIWVGGFIYGMVLAATLAIAADIKWSSFPDWSQSGGNVTGVGLQDGVNVKFPAPQTIIVGLSKTDIVALSSSPKVLISAPGSGKAIQVLSFLLRYNFGLSPYYTSSNGPTTHILYDGNSDAIGNFGDMIVGSMVSQFTSGFAAQEGATYLLLTDIDNKAIVLQSNSDFNLGSINTSALNVGGSGYSVGDTGTISRPGFGDDATFIIDTVDGGGAVLTYHLTNNGSRYGVSLNNATVIDSGPGDGFTVDISSITQGDGDIVVVITYRIVNLTGTP